MKRTPLRAALPAGGLARIAVRLLAATLLVQLPSFAGAQALENAYFVCDIFEKTGISTECQVEHVARRFEAKVDTSEDEAQKICAIMVGRLADKKRFFGPGWKLSILSPERAQAPLAECTLR
jgi:hypothetical protein